MDALLVRNSLKMFTAVFITAAIALWFERIEFVWYPLMAVVIVVDDNDDHTVKAATARVMGTVESGLVTFLPAAAATARTSTSSTSPRAAGAVAAPPSSPP